MQLNLNQYQEQVVKSAIAAGIAKSEQEFTDKLFLLFTMDLINQINSKKAADYVIRPNDEVNLAGLNK